MRSNYEKFTQAVSTVESEILRTLIALDKLEHLNPVLTEQESTTIVHPGNSDNWILNSHFWRANVWSRQCCEEFKRYSSLTMYVRDYMFPTIKSMWPQINTTNMIGADKIRKALGVTNPNLLPEGTDAIHGVYAIQHARSFVNTFRNESRDFWRTVLFGIVSVEIYNTSFIRCTTTWWNNQVLQWMHDDVAHAVELYNYYS